MLPIFKAFSIERAPIKGGSTYPCLLSVIDEQNNVQHPHVVKIFKPAHQSATCREVFANVLAVQFDLRVPPAALVKVEFDLLTELRQIPEYSRREMEPGYYFGTEMLQDALDYTSAFTESKIDNWNPEMIFAFDVLIRNVDRRMAKPNFFLHNDEPVLIDHELSLNVSQSFHWYKNPNLWKPFQANAGQNRTGHVFFSHLKKKKRKQKLDFGLFIEYLRVLDIDALYSYDKQLNELGCYDEEFTEIIRYLMEIKQNAGQFYQLLQDLLKDESETI